MRPTFLLATALAVVLPATAVAAPTGTIAFEQRNRHDVAQLYVARADGSSGPVRLTSRATAADPTKCVPAPCFAEAADFAADGSRIFFDAPWSGGVAIWSIAPDGSGPAQVTHHATWDGFPGVADDLTAIATDTGPPEGKGDLRKAGIYYGPIGGARRQLTRGPRHGFDTSPDVSPDGKRIAFVRQRERKHTIRAAIYVVGTDGSGLHRVVDGRKVWGDPHWSPDGSKLLIQSWNEGVKHGGTSDEFTVKPDGTALHALTHTGKHAVSFSGSWSPDGTQIVYVRGEEQVDHLMVRIMSADGRDQSLVAACDPKQFCDNPVWGPYAGPLPAH